MEDYRLTQSGQEVQDILNGAAMQVDLTAETERATEAEQTLQDNIDAEATRAQGAEGTLQDNIDAEEARAQGAEGTLQDNIDAEEARAKAAEKQNADDIDAIEEKIPSGASSSNKLATEEYVNDSVATATATFRGTYNVVTELSLLPSATHSQISASLKTEIATADSNDYAFVLIPTSVETPEEIEKIERYKYNGSVWGFEYVLNNSGFTAAQWAAINSGITSNAVGKLDALPNNAELTILLNGKQDTLTFDNVPTQGSSNPVKSGGVYSAIKSEETRAMAAESQNANGINALNALVPAGATSENKLATIGDVDAVSSAIEAILLLIPSAASALNQLADKAFVNSSIATATATFRGTYNLVTDLSLNVKATHSQIAGALGINISTADNNDYAFVQIPTSLETPTEIRVTERYKFDGTSWAFEYDLNNSGFTSAQWAAINSGITIALVGKLNGLPTNAELTTLLNGKQDTLTFDDVPAQGSTNPVKSSGIYNVIKAITVLIPAEATAQNQLADKADVAAKIVAAIPSWKGQYDALTDLQAVTGAKAGDMGCVKTTDSDGHAVLTFYQYSAQGAWVVYYTLRHYAQNKPATTGTTGDYPYNGMGRIELQKNIVNGVNTLTQAMLTQQNTVYVIQYDFTLGEDITVPVNSVLEFDGGSISGAYTITGANTGIQAGLVKIFNTDITLAGAWNMAEAYSEWFGGGNNTILDNTAIEKTINLLTNGGIIRLLSKKYYVSHIELPVGVSVIGSYSRNVEDINHGTIVCCHNTTSSSVFKLNSGCRLQGVTLYYPDQNPTNPIEYYWSIEIADGSGYTTVKDILFLCVFRGIYCPGTHDCLVLEDVYGHVMNRGVYSYFARDVDKYTNVQLTYAPLLQHLYRSGIMTYEEAYSYGDYTVANGIAFKIRRGDLTTLENCFALGFKVAIWLGNDTRNNSLVGSRIIINNFGSDGNQQFLRCIDFGNVYINNLMMTQYNGVRLTPTDVADITAAIHIVGKVVNIRFNNCLFIDPSDSMISFDAYDDEDTLTIANSYFSVSSHIKSKYKAFIEMYKGSALISNCVFKGNTGDDNVYQIQGINLNNNTKAYLDNVKFISFAETNTFNVSGTYFLRINNAEYLNCRTNNQTEDQKLEKIFGNTANRPQSPIYGFQYFDTTLGKPIFWVNKWVDANGTDI